MQGKLTNHLAMVDAQSEDKRNYVKAEICRYCLAEVKSDVWKVLQLFLETKLQTRGKVIGDSRESQFIYFKYLLIRNGLPLRIFSD